MTLKVLLFGCLLAASLVAAERYGVSRGRQEGFGGHGGYGGQGGYGGGFGGHGPPHGGHGPPFGGHGPSHGGYRPPHGGHGGHDGHGGFPPCDSGCHHRPHPQEPKQPQEPHPKEPKQPEEQPHPQDPHPLEPKESQTPEIKVDFIVHEPEGLEVWIVPESEVVFFGIELYVNTKPSKAGAKCDVCTNTTVITNGKLLIEDVDVVVKKGDVLHYYALIGNGHSVVRQKLQALHVTEFLIGKCNCPGPSDIEDIDIRFNEKGSRTARAAQYIQFDPFGGDDLNDVFGTTARPVDLEPVYEPRVLSKEEVKLVDELDDLRRDHFFLGRIIEYMSMRKGCAANTTNTLLLQKLPFPATRASDLDTFLRSYFKDHMDLQKLDRAIRKVSLANGGQGIEFEMENYVDKQMVLYWTRKKKLDAPIVDPDFVQKVDAV